MTRFIGDVHGHIREYLDIISGDCEQSVQIGDMGVGFEGVDLPTTYADKHKFIRGNHDDPAKCKAHPAYIPDGHITNDIMFIGGAWSIDWEHRTPGVTWWADEQCSYEELNRFIDLAVEKKPKMIVTHEPPEFCVPTMFNGNVIRTRTGQALEVIQELVKPELWIFGHWHINKDMTVNGTRFLCLGELAYVDIPLPVAPTF